MPQKQGNNYIWLAPCKVPCHLILKQPVAQRKNINNVEAKNSKIANNVNLDKYTVNFETGNAMSRFQALVSFSMLAMNDVRMAIPKTMASGVNECTFNKK